jgi:hypothetical protein
MVTASDWKARWGEGGSEEISARGGDTIRSLSVPCRAVPCRALWLVAAARRAGRVVVVVVVVEGWDW